MDKDIGYLETVARQLRESFDIGKEIQKETEKAMASKPRGLPVAEIDAELSFGGESVAVTLAVWGT